MELCKRCGIVYEDSNCPLCEANDQIKTLEAEVEDLINIVAELEREKDD
jgi:RNA polymerase subunit RPABC4/transcription elongation factor Spt4